MVFSLLCSFAPLLCSESPVVVCRVQREVSRATRYTHHKIAREQHTVSAQDDKRPARRSKPIRSDENDNKQPLNQSNDDLKHAAHSFLNVSEDITKDDDLPGLVDNGSPDLPGDSTMFQRPYLSLAKQCEQMKREHDTLRMQLVGINDRLADVMIGMQQIQQIHGVCTTTLATLQERTRGSTTLKEVASCPVPQALSRRNYPLVTYWTKEDWDKRLKKAFVPGQSDHSTAAKCPFIQKADGGPLSKAEWGRLNAFTRGVFNRLDPVPSTWMARSLVEQRISVYRTLILEFPYLGLGEGYWKAEKYVINQYPHWIAARKKNNKREGKNVRKRKAEEGV